MQETNYHEAPPTIFEPASQATAEQERLLEMEETIQILVRRNQDMERQFRTEIENLKQQHTILPPVSRHALTPAPPVTGRSYTIG